MAPLWARLWRRPPAAQAPELGCIFCANSDPALQPGIPLILTVLHINVPPPPPQVSSSNIPLKDCESKVEHPKLQPFKKGAGH